MKQLCKNSDSIILVLKRKLLARKRKFPVPDISPEQHVVGACGVRNTQIRPNSWFSSKRVIHNCSLNSLPPHPRHVQRVNTRRSSSPYPYCRGVRRGWKTRDLHCQQSEFRPQSRSLTCLSVFRYSSCVCWTRYEVSPCLIIMWYWSFLCRYSLLCLTIRWTDFRWVFV